MNIRVNKERGFSLIELLVVVAIIGVLAAVGVVGYQGYIDSTKKSVTESNAKAVQQWFRNTKTVRAAGIDVDPDTCRGTSNLASACISALTRLSPTVGPFQSFKNAYDNDRTAASTISSESPTGGWTKVTDSGTTACPSGTELGDVLIEHTSAATVNTTYEIWYCAKDGSGNARIFTRDGWTITWD